MQPLITLAPLHMVGPLQATLLLSAHHFPCYGLIDLKKKRDPPYDAVGKKNPRSSVGVGHPSQSRGGTKEGECFVSREGFNISIYLNLNPPKFDAPHL